MLDASEAYQRAIFADIRRIVPKCVINLLDPDVTFGAVTSTGEIAYSKPAQLYDHELKSSGPRYATLEHNRWTLDGSVSIFPENPAETSGEIGFIGAALCGADGAFAVPQVVSLNFTGVSILQACAVYFNDRAYDGIGVDFTVDVLSGADVVYTKSFTDNQAHAVFLDGFTVNEPTAVRVTVTKWSVPYRRARLLEIIPGIYETWEGDTLYSVDVYQQVGFDCLSLPNGTCDISVYNEKMRFDPFNKAGLFKSIDERIGIPVWYGVELEDGSTEYLPLGVFYPLAGGWATRNNGIIMQFQLQDIIGLLKDKAYIAPGTLPTTLDGWAASIVSQLGVNFASMYVVDEAISSVELTCTESDLADATCGDMILWICMAAGGVPSADPETGYLKIAKLGKDMGVGFDLDNMSEYPTLERNEDLADVVFTLSDGTQYVVGGTSTASGKSAQVKNPFLHTTDQARFAAQAILSQYGGLTIHLNGRGDMRSMPGDLATVDTAFGSKAYGRVYQQQFKLGQGVMTQVPMKLLQSNGYEMYENCVIITESGTWTAPDGVTQIAAVIINGGDGGEFGEDGSYMSGYSSIDDPYNEDTVTWDNVPAYPKGGAGGQSGKVYAVTLEINPNQSFAVQIGQGGLPGQAGGVTTFGPHSGNLGKHYDGWADVVNGNVYAVDGAQGKPNTEPPTAGADAASGTGNGGQGGYGGTNGAKFYVNGSGLTWRTLREPTSGGSGGNGATGCVIIYYDKEETA